MKLSQAQIQVLSFIRDNEITRAEWRQGKRPAHGHPDQWTHLALRSPNGSIDVQAADVSALEKHIEPGTDNSIFVLSDFGRRSLEGPSS